MSMCRQLTGDHLQTYIFEIVEVVPDLDMLPGRNYKLRLHRQSNIPLNCFARCPNQPSDLRQSVRFGRQSPIQHQSHVRIGCNGHAARTNYVL